MDHNCYRRETEKCERSRRKCENKVPEQANEEVISIYYRSQLVTLAFYWWSNFNTGPCGKLPYGLYETIIRLGKLKIGTDHKSSYAMADIIVNNWNKSFKNEHWYGIWITIL